MNYQLLMVNYFIIILLIKSRARHLLIKYYTTLTFDWSKIQWLIAALGVGLGFGLQEIFANFISGLIILFEKPVRIGDTVTIRDLTGKIDLAKDVVYV
ncbi:Small-conductance mechanosensitive channel, partial [Snodgrassella alvi SCGC AB-598-P14]